MSLTAEQEAELVDALPGAEPEAEPADAPSSGEHPAGEQPAEGAELAAGAENEAEGEKKPKEGASEQPKPEDKRAWRQVEAAKRAQVLVSKARQALDNDVQRVRSYETSVQARETEIVAREARVRPLEAALEAGDLQGLIDLGFDYEKFTRGRLEENRPDAIARRALDENRKLRDQIAADKKKADADARAQASIAETRTIAQNLVAIVEEAPNERPELYAWAPERIAEEGLAIRAALYRARGVQPTYATVLEELSRRAKADADVAKKRTSALQQRTSANPSDAGSAGKAEQQRGASTSPGTPALTARTATERTPVPPREKTEEEIDEECRQMLRGLRR